MAQNRVFAYIIATVDSRYRLTGHVPCVEDGKVFFGPCKRPMRPDVKKGDYVLGISGSAASSPRRVLLWMKVEEAITFMEAWKRGKADRTFRGLRGGAIHIRPRKGAEALHLLTVMNISPVPSMKTTGRTTCEATEMCSCLATQVRGLLQRTAPRSHLNWRNGLRLESRGRVRRLSAIHSLRTQEESTCSLRERWPTT